MRKVTGFAIEEPGINYPETVRLLQEHRAISHGKSIEIVETLGQQAEGLRRLSKLRDSQRLFIKALHIARKTGISWSECWSLWGLGAVLRARGAYDLSRRMFTSSLLAAKHARDKRCALWSFAELSELSNF
jgi:Tetratricopeptide repeat